MKILKRALFMTAALSLLITAMTNTAGAEEKSAAELAKASQNPVSSLISVPFENNTYFNAGPEGATINTLSIKPVIPMSLTENWNLINRAIIPITYQEGLVVGQDNTFGLGDITYQGFLSPAKAGKLIWGFGPTVVMPTGSNLLSSDKWSMGPAAVALVMPGHWVLGVLAQNVWSVGGAQDSSAPDVNSMLIQYFINYNMAGGWYLSTAPSITADWEADSDNTWTVPFGGAIGRVFKIGKQPVNMKVGAYGNVEKPDGAPDWNLQLGLTFMFPK